MKRLSLLALLLLVLTLSACDSTVTSENGLDITDLDTCIDAMVTDVSSASCENPEKKELLTAYIQSFEGSFDTTDSNYNMSDFDFSSNKVGDEVRLEYWFQYTLLADTPTNNYTTFKDIVSTMMTDMRTMNDHPEFLITGEFFGLNNYHFIFRTDKDDNLEGEIQVFKLTESISDAVAETVTFLETYGIDTDLETQILDMLAEDYAVYVSVDVAAQEYQYKVYRETNDDFMTLAQVEALVEATLNAESLTKVAWTID